MSNVQPSPGAHLEDREYSMVVQIRGALSIPVGSQRLTHIYMEYFPKFTWDPPSLSHGLYEQRPLHAGPLLI